MRSAVLLTVAMLFLTVGALSADTVVTQEVVNVCGYVKGSTTLKLSGTFSEAAMEELSQGAEVSVRNDLANYLCAPVQLDKNKNGYGKKTLTQNVSAKTKNGKFSWAEKDVTKNFSFAVGSEIIKPTKATLKSSGTLQKEDLAEFETKIVTLFDTLCNENGSESVGAYAFIPEKKGENFKYSAKEQDLQVKFSANSKGKANMAYKFSPAAVSPAVIGENLYEDPFSVTNKLYIVIDLLDGNNIISYLDDVPEGGWTEEYKTTKLVLRKIEPGTFVMGTSTNELVRTSFETQHEVTLTQAYYIAVFETTQRQYELIAGENPSGYKGSARPVENVSYDMLRGDNKGTSWPASYEVDETSFFGKLRAKTGLAFDLPTEAQWEYACRAGTTTALNSGKDLSDQRECEEMAEVGRYGYNRDDGKGGYTNAHTTVGSYLPNAWGLYDMHGNVYEWCLDWFQNNLKDPATEPHGPSWRPYRAIRGGCWYNAADSCRSASREGGSDPSEYSRSGGFRVAIVQNAFFEPDDQIEKEFEYEIALGTENTLPIFQTKFYGKLKNGEEKLLEEMGKLEYDGASGIVAGVGKHKLIWIPDADYTNVMDEVDLRVEYEDVTEQATYLVFDTTSNKMRVSSDAPDTTDDKCRTDELWLRRIEPGTFIMGSPEDEVGREKSEIQHQVTLTKAYYIGVFEVTQRQCDNIMGDNPSWYKGDMRPVEYVSYDILRGANKGSAWPKNNGVDERSFMGQMRKKAGNTFDLPTEAQWEYACRAGTATALNSGKDLSNRFECQEMSEVGRYSRDYFDGKGGYAQHTKVGSYLPNAWGLYDMHGNVYEWCLDWFSSYKEDAIDPKGGERGEYRILRGGSFQDYAYCCRSAHRRDAFQSQGYPGFANFIYGIRVVLVP
ncbi:formylglycine-generating enzyme family protein [bacterium]|nr:formylglycine-generating enzyme family protein [bacterium]